MVISLGLDDAPDDPHSGSGGRATPGKGLVVCTGFEEFGGADGKAHKLTFEIAAWTDKECVGSEHSENIFHQDRTGKGWPKRRMLVLALATGIISQAEYAAAKAQDATIDLDFSKINGRPMKVVLIEQADKDDASKTYINVGGAGIAMYHIDDPKCKNWPTIAAVENKARSVVGKWVDPKTVAAEPGSGPDPFSGENTPF